MSTDPAPVQRLVGQLRGLIDEAGIVFPVHYWAAMGEIVGANGQGLLGCDRKESGAVIAAMNAIPALLAIAEAASLVRSEQDHMETCPAIRGPQYEQWVEESRCNCAMKRLREALDCLPNPQGSPGAAPVHPAVGQTSEDAQ